MNAELGSEEHKQRLALEGNDADIYPYLSSCSHATFKHYEGDRERLCSFIYISPYSTPEQGGYERRPETLPFTSNDLQAFLQHGLKSHQGYWSVYWASDAKPTAGTDVIYGDGFRSVISFRTIEFMIRPMKDFRDRGNARGEPSRLYIGWRDVETCLTKALDENRHGQMRTVTGVGYTDHPGKDKHRDKKEGKPQVTFEWRIDRAPQEKVLSWVKKWRYDMFKGAKNYEQKKKQYMDQRALERFDQQRQAGNPTGTQAGYPIGTQAGYPIGTQAGYPMVPQAGWSMDTQPGYVMSTLGGRLPRPYIPPIQPMQPERPPSPGRQRAKFHRGKRDSGEMSPAQDPSPSRKRRSMGSQSSLSSQSGSAPPSLTASPEMGRQTPGAVWGQPTMPPPPNPYHSQPVTAYGHPSYGPIHPASSPRLDQPNVAGFTYARPRSAFTDYSGSATPASRSYTSSPGAYSQGTAGASPAIPQYQGTPAGSWSGGSPLMSPPSSSPAMTPTGANAFQFQGPPASSAPGGGSDAWQHHHTSAGSQQAPGWWGDAGNYDQSGRQYGGHRSGNQGQYGGDSGSGQR